MSARRGGRARLRRRDAAGQRPGLRARAGLRGGGAGGRGAARAVAPRSPRWWRPRCRPTSGASPASCRASGRRCVEVLALAGDRGGVRVAAARRRDAGRARRASIRERPVAVCRELTKLHEEVVRGTAAELAERYAEEGPRGEVVLVFGGAPPRDGRRPGRDRRGAPAVDAGARRARRPRRRRRAHRRGRQRALPRGRRALSRARPRCSSAPSGVTAHRATWTVQPRPESSPESPGATPSPASHAVPARATPAPLVSGRLRGLRQLCDKPRAPAHSARGAVPSRCSRWSTSSSSRRSRRGRSRSPTRATRSPRAPPRGRPRARRRAGARRVRRRVTFAGRAGPR